MVSSLVVVFDLNERLAWCSCELSLELGSVTSNPSSVGPHGDVETIVETSLEEVLVVTVDGTKIVAGRRGLRAHGKGVGDLEDGVDADGLGQIGTSTVEQKVGGVDTLDLALQMLDGSGVGKFETGANVLNGSKRTVEGCNDGLEEAEHGGGRSGRDGWSHAGGVSSTLLVKERRRCTRTDTLSAGGRRSLNAWWVGSGLWRSDGSRHGCCTEERKKKSRN